ncbi:PaaX family transcriptional regulator C-terminal domain-containing protein [Limnobacter sp.]|uniref:PaaX family transcriptional regulator C-terminal domain-containing protein n=1 Tax=Limnobacter sp. TaxID=2003368 RepID=UPI002E36E95E|nr:PaaX family transcriptional regulator C-terminal domain-containing protein [Limnobacter sp.]
MKKPTAKSLILDLLLASKGRPISAKQAITACGIFDISVNNTRVALVRLSAEGLIEAAGRALYQLTEDAHTLADHVASWRSRSLAIRPWTGGYIMVQADKLPRNEAKQQRTRDRALLMLGFRPLNEQLYIRPDNIETCVADVRESLYRLGLEKTAPVFFASEFDSELESRIKGLWNITEIERNYAHFQKKMSTWIQRHHELEPEVAARESFLLGGAAIKHVLYDPRLPEQWTDTRARAEFLNVVQELDQTGQDIWLKYWESLDLKTASVEALE